jgi:hypothetical protein
LQGFIAAAFITATPVLVLAQQHQDGTAHPTIHALAPAFPAATPTPDPAAGRVAIASITTGDATTDDVNATLSRRLADDFEKQSVTVVPLDAPITQDVAFTPTVLCYDNHVEAIMYPLIAGQTGGDFSDVWGELVVRDCSGTIVFAAEGERRKVTAFNFKGYKSIAKDLGLDLMADLERQFADYQAKNAGAWSSLMANGIAIDPQCTCYLSMATILSAKDGSWIVGHVYHGGPADVAGLRVDDVVESIDGTVLNPHVDIPPLMNKPSYAITVRRHGEELTLTVTPKHYADLISFMKKPAPPVPSAMPAQPSQSAQAQPSPQPTI